MPKYRVTKDLPVKRPKYKDPEREDTCKVDFACGWNSCCDAWEEWLLSEDDLKWMILTHIEDKVEEWRKGNSGKKELVEMIVSLPEGLSQVLHKRLKGE